MFVLLLLINIIASYEYYIYCLIYILKVILLENKFNLLLNQNKKLINSLTII